MRRISVWTAIQILFKMASKFTHHPASERNKKPIADILQKYLSKDAKMTSLEISSGSGLHSVYYAECFPNVTWQPSEYDLESVKNIEGYRREVQLANVLPPLHIDVSKPIAQWAGVQPQYDFLLNINMIHISPYACTEGLFTAAGILLKSGSYLFTYGPYAKNGVLTPDSNVQFDQYLRGRNPDWGIRDIEALKKVAETNGFQLETVHDMPANNNLLVWIKT